MENTNKNKEQLIRDLASSFGMPDISKDKYGSSRYDVATGTFYCDGVLISKHTMDKAIKHYEEQMNYLRPRSVVNGELLDAYLFATIAFNAITMLRKDLIEGDES